MAYKDGNTEEKLASQIKQFTEKRRKQVYDGLNEIEEERYNAFREAFGKSVLNKVVTFIKNLPGTKPSFPMEVAQVITSAAKMHAGELVELAKQI